MNEEVKLSLFVSFSRGAAYIQFENLSIEWRQSKAGGSSKPINPQSIHIHFSKRNERELMSWLGCAACWMGQRSLINFICSTNSINQLTPFNCATFSSFIQLIIHSIKERQIQLSSFVELMNVEWGRHSVWLCFGRLLPFGGAPAAGSGHNPPKKAGHKAKLHSQTIPQQATFINQFHESKDK